MCWGAGGLHEWDDVESELLPAGEQAGCDRRLRAGLHLLLRDVSASIPGQNLSSRGIDRLNGKALSKPRAIVIVVITLSDSALWLQGVRVLRLQPRARLAKVRRPAVRAAPAQHRRRCRAGPRCGAILRLGIACHRAEGRLEGFRYREDQLSLRAFTPRFLLCVYIRLPLHPLLPRLPFLAASISCHVS